jgi:hypothetical protein
MTTEDQQRAARAQSQIGIFVSVFVGLRVALAKPLLTVDQHYTALALAVVAGLCHVVGLWGARAWRPSVTTMGSLCASAAAVILVLLASNADSMYESAGALLFLGVAFWNGVHDVVDLPEEDDVPSEFEVEADSPMVIAPSDNVHNATPSMNPLTP